MNPQATISPQAGPVAPIPSNVNPQGVASVAPLQAPVASQLPQSTPQAIPAAPTAPPTNTANALQTVANYYQIPRNTAMTVGAGESAAGVAQGQFEAQKYQNSLAIQHEKEMLDPSTYSFNHNPDGTLSIKNSVGDTVSLSTFYNLAGSKQFSSPAEVLDKHGATDAASLKFVTAYNNFQDYARTQIAAQNGDEQAKIKLGEYQKTNPGLANLNLGQLKDAFMAQYGDYFGAQASNALPQAGVNPTISSQNSPVAATPYQELAQYPQLATPNPITQQLLGAPSLASQLSGLNSQIGQ